MENTFATPPNPKAARGKTSPPPAPAKTRSGAAAPAGMLEPKTLSEDFDLMSVNTNCPDT